VESEFAPVVLAWSHFLRRTDSHFAEKCSDGLNRYWTAGWRAGRSRLGPAEMRADRRCNHRRSARVGARPAHATGCKGAQVARGGPFLLTPSEHDVAPRESCNRAEPRGFGFVNRLSGDCAEICGISAGAMTASQRCPLRLFSLKIGTGWA
jgi:hypothetical protein